MKQFTIRVYGIFIENGYVLLSDEVYGGKSFTKFPGGGLEWGEGTVETLQREICEELKVKVQNIRHFYTTDFFVASSFDPNKQVISVYYMGDLENKISSTLLATRPKENLPEKGEWFRWVALEHLSGNDLTFPIDKHVLKLIKATFR